MALCDYRLCDKCNQKVFYDSNLNYVWNKDTGLMDLEYLGDWAVICNDCAKTWKCIIVERARKCSADE